LFAKASLQDIKEPRPLDSASCEGGWGVHSKIARSLMGLTLPKRSASEITLSRLGTFTCVQDALRLIRIVCQNVADGQSKLRVLIIEDEHRLAENIARSLREVAGYAVDIAPDGEDGLFLAESSEYDAVLLDLMLPKLDGLEVLNRLRKGGSRTPVLVLTARDEKESVVSLLNAGADDYLTKPFDLGELIARTKALIRRGKGQSSPTLAIGDLELNTVNRSVRRGGRPVTLTAMEYRVLEYLAHRPGAVVSKTELLEHLYDYNWEKFSNVIEVYISGLRRKLEHNAARPLIHTLRGQGYMLEERP